MKEKLSAQAMRDLKMILVVAAIALVAAVYFDAFEELERWAQRYERWQIDELVVVPLVFGLAFGFYFWRRGKELEAEASRREEAQNALEGSEKRFRSLIQNAKDIIMLMNADGTVGYLNPAVEEMLGYKPEDIIGTDSFTPVHPDDAARVRDVFADAVNKPGTTSWVQLRLQHADGPWRHIETYCTNLLHDPTVRGIVVNSRDVTGRRHAEEALRESEERFRLLAENAQDVVFRARLEPTPRVEYISPSVTAMTGYEPEEFYADPHLGRRLVHPEDSQMLDEALRSVSGSPIALRWLHKDGGVIWAEQRNNPIHDEAGQLVAIEGIARDVTERKRAEKKLQESEANLTDAQRIAHLGSWEYEPKNDRVYWSDETYRIFGFTPQQFVPTFEDFLNTIHSDDRGLIQENMAKLLRGEQIRDGLEFRVVRANGEVRYVEGQRSAELGETGELVRMFGTLQDITERKLAEETLRRREAILQAVSFAADLFLEKKTPWGESIRAVLKALGEATRVSRVYIFENFTGEDSTLFTRQRYEWVAPGVTPEIDNPALQALPWRDAGFGRWLETLSRAQPIYGHVRNFPRSEQHELNAEGIRSIAVVPIFVEQEWWGHIGFDACLAERNWSAAEIEALKAAAATLGAAIQRNRAEEQLQQSEERYRSVVDNVKEVIFQTDAEGLWTLLNPAWTEVTGFSVEESIGKSFLNYVHPEDRERNLELFQSLIERKKGYCRHEIRYLTREGGCRWIEVWVRLTLDEDNAIVGTSGTLNDITERKQAEDELRKSEARNRAIIEATPDLMFRVSRDGEYLDLQVSDESMLYLPPGEIVGKNLRDTMPPDLVPAILGRVAKVLDTGEMQVLEYQLPVAEGIRDFEARVVEAGSEEVLAIVRDITERKSLERRLEYRAFYDSLTGLPNRALFLDRLEHALARVERHRVSVAVLFVDLDNFKVINDSLGHEAGDALLVAVAERLQECLRPEDTTARLSGDEFAVLLEDVEGTNDATVVAERIAKALRDPFALEGQKAFVTASIGIAFGGSSQEPPGALLRSADLAMYRAKETGKAHHELFRPEMNERALRRLSLDNELRRALERDELRVYYQPKVLLGTEPPEHLRASGRGAITAQKAPEPLCIVGMEALVRWEHPERGLLPPGEFVPFAEENGLIVLIGRWVLEEACRQAKEWQEQDPSNPPLMMSVNVSAAQFRCPELFEDIARVLRETGLEAGTLTLEITESVLLEDAQANANTLERLKGLGVRLAIDDFGTGYSSLSYLKRLSVDYLKIDKSFIASLGQDSRDRLLVSGVIYLAHELGLKVIAEGVESAEQLAQLQQMGCDMAQGYYFSRPLAAEAATLLASGPEASLGY